uniref:Uncharacterized protein n=1 Tax=Leptobrachium leishanense TaxID=445787 RepID=A0A8C5LW81_9ANUR
MANLQQMKTSFLYIQLQSPSKSAERSEKACSLAGLGNVSATSREPCDTERPASPQSEDTQSARSNLEAQTSPHHQKRPKSNGTGGSHRVCTDLKAQTGTYYNKRPTIYEDENPGVTGPDLQPQVEICDREIPDYVREEDRELVCSDLRAQPDIDQNNRAKYFGKEFTWTTCGDLKTDASDKGGATHARREDSKSVEEDIKTQTGSCSKSSKPDGNLVAQTSRSDIEEEDGTCNKMSLGTTAKQNMHALPTYGILAAQSRCDAGRSDCVDLKTRQHSKPNRTSSSGEKDVPLTCCKLGTKPDVYDKNIPASPRRDDIHKCTSILNQHKEHSPVQPALSRLSICTAMSNGTETGPSAAQAFAVPLVNSTDMLLLPDFGKKQKDEEITEHKHQAHVPETYKVTSTSGSPSSCLRYVSSSWNTMDQPSRINEEKVWWKVEVCKPSLVKTPILLKSPESKTFRDAVDETSSRLSEFSGRTEGQLLATNYAMTVTTVTPIKLQKAERYVWVNGSSAHSQNVAKAKYAFLFGESMESTIKTAPEPDEPGNTRLLPQTTSVTNEFPEYGTTEYRDIDTPGIGNSSEPAPCVEELKELGPLMQNDSLKEKYKPCMWENLKNGECSENECAETHCSSKPSVSTGQLHTEALVDGNPSGDCSPSLKEVKSDHSIESLNFAKQVQKPEEPNQEKTPQSSLAVVPGERKTYLYVERELPAISEEETISLSESSLSQITEIADFPKSQDNIPVSFTLFVDNSSTPMEDDMKTNPDLRKCFGNRSSQADPTAGRVYSANAGCKEDKFHKGHVDMVEPWGTRLPSSDEDYEDRTSVVSTDTSMHIQMSERTRGVRGASTSGSDSFKHHDGVENEVFIKETDFYDELPVLGPPLQSSRIVAEDLPEEFRSKRCSEDSTDLYSSQFENILDNTSLYYSVESLDTLYYEPDSFFSFEMPLTPMIQQRIKETSHFMDRSSASDGQQEFLKVDSGSGITMGYCNHVINGLDEVTGIEFSKSTDELVFSESAPCFPRDCVFPACARWTRPFPSNHLQNWAVVSFAFRDWAVAGGSGALALGCLRVGRRVNIGNRSL